MWFDTGMFGSVKMRYRWVEVLLTDWGKEGKNMEILIELTEKKLDAVAGAFGDATFTLTDMASGSTTAVSGTATVATTSSSASIDGSFSASAFSSSPAPPMRG
jgi:hypothetical protein